MLDPDKREKHRKSNQGDAASQRKKRLIVDKPEGYRGWSNRDPNRTHGTGIRIRLILITCLASVLLQLGQSSHPPQCGLLLLQGLQDLGVDRNLLLRFLILLKVDATKQGVGLKLVWKEVTGKLGGVPNRKHCFQPKRQCMNDTRVQGTIFNLAVSTIRELIGNITISVLLERGG